MTKMTKKKLIEKGHMKEPRTKEEITKDYNETCLQAGEKGYRVKVLQAEIDNLNRRLLEINKEFWDLSQRENGVDATEATENGVAPAQPEAVQ